MFIHTARDAQLNTVNLPLYFERTFSSVALSTEGALGKGWLSVLDASAAPGPGGTMRVTYPDGRQEQLGQTPSGWVGATGLAVDDRLTVNPDGSVTATQISGEVAHYDRFGELTSIDDPGAGSWDFS